MQLTESNGSIRNQYDGAKCGQKSAWIVVQVGHPVDNRDEYRGHDEKSR